MDERIVKIESEITTLKARNVRVEADKAWETSWCRIVMISSMTYIIAVVFMWSIGVIRPWLGALVPVVWFIFSTLSLPPIKKWWIGQKP